MSALGKIIRASLAAGFVAAGSASRATDEYFDQLEQALTWSTSEGQWRSRISGTLDLEAYALQLPAPGLLRSNDQDVFAPRLTLFFDGQLGPRVYMFAQARADRGFDPAEGRLETRLDEYAVRYTPWDDGRINLQLGKFTTIVGTWAARHGSWANPFITAPLAYEQLTGMWDTEALLSANTLLEWSHVRPGLPDFVTAREKDLRIPIIWGPSYATGVAISGRRGGFFYAAEMKHASLSSRPDAWLHARAERDHPTVSARVGYQPNEMWQLGMSASRGSYLRDFAESTLVPGYNLGDYRQTVLGYDLSFAWRHVQVWTEIFGARFEIPTVGDADVVSYYVEAKYKFTPQLFGAIRWNQQLYGTLPEGPTHVRWGRDVWRIDVAPTYRFTTHAQLKLQYSLQRGDSGPRHTTQTMAAQFTVRF